MFIFIMLALSKVLGQVRDSVMLSVLGTNSVSDAYACASGIPLNFFDMILGSAISAAFIPVYNKFAQKEGKERANAFSSRFLNVIALATTVLSIVGVIAASLIINTFYNLEQQVLAIQLLQIMFPVIIFVGLSFTLVGVLQSEGQYNIPAIMSIVSNAVCIIYLLTMHTQFGVHGLAWAMLIGWTLQFVMMIYPSKRVGFRYKLSYGLRDEGLKDVVKLALPVLFATWVQPANVLINSMVATNIGTDGSIAALNSANRLYITIAGLLAISLTNYIFPKLSQMFVEEDEENWQKTVMMGLKVVLLLMPPIAMVFLINSEQIIRVVYGYGAFDNDSVALTAPLLFYYAIGMLGFSLQEIVNKAFYSRYNTKAPTIIALCTIGLNLGLSLGLSHFMGVPGVALSASLSASVFAIISVIVMMKKTNMQGAKDLLIYIGKIVVMFAVSCGVTLLVKTAAQGYFGAEGLMQNLLVTALCAGAGFVVFFGLALVFKIDQMQLVLNMITSKLKRKGA